MFLKTVLLVVCMINAIHSVSLEEFFPFGTQAGDEIFPANDDGSTNALSLPANFPYFDNNHRKIYLANNGLFSFLGPISTFVPDPFPLSDDRRLIAGFWSDIDTRGYIPSGNQVFYHIYSNEDNTTAFEKATSYVQQFFPSEHSFNPTMIITGTWYRVGAFSQQTNKKNTFQIVLVSDSMRSFAFMLYHDMQWANPGYTNSSAYTSGQAGFNAGDGVIFQLLPYSRTADIIRLTEISNVNVPGLFAFRIDTDTITLGGCGENSTMQFRPRRGSQLGSTAITIQGPCFTNLSESAVKCRFGDSLEVDAIVIDDFQAICLTPSVPLPTFANVYLSINGGWTYEAFPSTFTYTRTEFGMISSDDSEVIVVNQEQLSIAVGSEITLQWFLSDRTMKTWPNETIQLQVQMWSVILNETNGGIILNTHTVLQSNIAPTAGLQSTSVTIASLGSTYTQPIFFRIVALDLETNLIYAALSSALFVLNDTTAGSTDYCQRWAAGEPEPTTWNENLLLCPLRLSQARVARCCYEADPLCSEYNQDSPLNCALHRGREGHDEPSAVACYVSLTRNEAQSGAECCYDGEGQLITHGTGAGTDDRYRPGSLPILHFFGDILPYIGCCLSNSNFENCETYFRLRPIRSGSNTRNPSGGAWGDPHFITLDGTAYTFNGYGEYTYLAVTDSALSTQTLVFNSQVRTAPLNSTSNTVTVIRGFAAKSNHPDAKRMSITISRRNTLIVRRGNETLDLDITNDDRISSNNSLAIVFPELVLEKNRTNGALTLSWSIGISIQITPIPVTGGLLLNLGISVSNAHLQRTFGLLGLYDNDPTNDLRTPNGTVVGQPSTLTLEQIHYEFGQAWTINPSQSFFYYESGDSALFYANQTLQYRPLFELPELSTAEMNAIRSACGIASSATNQSTWTVAQQTCYYDIAVTNDLSLGEASRLVANTIAQTEADQRYAPEFNSSLPLTLAVNANASVSINFTAISPYTTDITYTLVQGPASATFNPATAIFRWTVPSTGRGLSAVVRVSAQDTLYNLVSTRDLVIRDVVSSVPPTSLGTILRIAWMFLLVNLVGTFVLL
ncbi:unnamed protein product [Adineta ricciae]|uniref:Uncharacterized protein n=1 Tax=Adineta ricciae TaxID=249248 RepID=A0A815JE36_ADIRI|nr:unnamed protein product [Adineta ricciae]CAF1527258.1 unnamed protein product [Adineta ricciae]